MTNGIYYIFVQGKSIKKVLDVAKATVFQIYAYDSLKQFILK